MCTRTLKRRCHKANYQYSVVGFFMQKNRERIGKVTEVNKAKEYLLQVSRAEHRIKRLQEEIQTLQELVTSTSAISQGERVISSTSQDKMADTICTIEERIEEWNTEVRKLVEIRAEIMTTNMQTVYMPFSILTFLQHFYLFSKFRDTHNAGCTVKKYYIKGIASLRHGK